MFIPTDLPHQLLHQYGSVSLFFLLALGILGLPIPDETLLLIAGFLSAKGHLSIAAVIIAAYCGSCIGITISYFLGRFVGHSVILHYGNKVGITEKKLNAAHNWFQKIGKYLLVIGYFIPGIRHLSGIVAGTTELEYPSFALFAYLGAILWSSTFLYIGYFFLSVLPTIRL